MPRTARRITPGHWYHVMFRGVGGSEIFRDDDDRRDFLDRMDRVWSDGDAHCTAWALMTTHGHLKVGASVAALGTLMKRVLGGYASRFNARHGRFGHLFQDRFLSVPVQGDQHFHHLDAYVFGNPLAAGLVPSIDVLCQYEWSGLGALLGVRRPRAFHDVRLALAHLGGDVTSARARLLSRLELVRESADDNLLGASARLFNGDLQVTTLTPPPSRRCVAQLEAEGTVDTLNRAASIAAGVDPAAVLRGARSRWIARVRALVAHAAVDRLGIPGRTVCRRLGVSPQAVSVQCSRGRRSWLEDRDSASVVAALEGVLAKVARSREVESGEPSPTST